jgi:hypothetical protein
MSNMKRILFGTKQTKTPRSKQRTTHEPSPLYKYAVQEYQQTVAPGSSNDNGKEFEKSYEIVPSLAEPSRGSPLIVETVLEDDEEVGLPDTMTRPQHQNNAETSPMPSLQRPFDVPPPNSSNSTRKRATTPYRHMDMESDVASVFRDPRKAHLAHSQLPEAIMPDTTYEEQYGDAYISAPLKYVYPSGYQSMRPRGGPWKLSVGICILFTWLSIFTVGHCSDRIDSTQYQSNEIDDDALVIETRWCGSRLLYLMWVMSMLITGLAAAYCSIIGYIKVRDFAVANIRSQPPGLVGKSDYYVEIKDYGRNSPTGGSSAGSEGSHPRYYQQSIYQSDGTPQFWGNHIYRPTQAAVAVTSR